MEFGGGWVIDLDIEETSSEAWIGVSFLATGHDGVIRR